jgi:hypothetical protein
MLCAVLLALSRRGDENGRILQPIIIPAQSALQTLECHYLGGKAIANQYPPQKYLKMA